MGCLNSIKISKTILLNLIELVLVWQILFGRFCFVCLVSFGNLDWKVWFGRFGLVVWFGRFGLIGLVWYVWFGMFGLAGLVWLLGLEGLVIWIGRFCCVSFVWII